MGLGLGIMFRVVIFRIFFKGFCLYFLSELIIVSLGIVNIKDGNFLLVDLVGKGFNLFLGKWYGLNLGYWRFG